MTNASIVGVVRAAALAGALVLSVLSRGDALVLGMLLGMAAWRLPALAVVPALVAVSWRWGSTSLEAWAGAQAVLGPAGVVGPAGAAAACWLAATAVVLAAPTEVGGTGARWRRMGAPNLPEAGLAAVVGGTGARWRRMGAPNLATGVMAVTTGSVSAAVVAGPALGGAVWARVLATLAGALLALAVSWVRARRPLMRRVSDVLAVVTGVGALVLASLDAPAWSGTVDGGALAAGALVAVAVAALVVVASQAVGARRLHRA